MVASVGVNIFVAKRLGRRDVAVCATVRHPGEVRRLPSSGRKVDLHPVVVIVYATAGEFVLHVVPNQHPQRISWIKRDSLHQRLFEGLDEEARDIRDAPNHEKRSDRRLERHQQPKLQEDAHVSRVDIVQRHDQRHSTEEAKRNVDAEQLHNEDNTERLVLVKLKDSILHQHFEVFTRAGDDEPTSNLEDEQGDEKPEQASKRLFRLHAVKNINSH